MILIQTFFMKMESIHTFFFGEEKTPARLR